jgi:hypothetical protein
MRVRIEGPVWTVSQVGGAARIHRLRAASDPVKVAELRTGQELLPLSYREFADRRIRVTCVADQDKVTLTCDSYALTAVAGARDMPDRIGRVRAMC